MIYAGVCAGGGSRERMRRLTLKGAGESGGALHFYSKKHRV